MDPKFDGLWVAISSEGKSYIGKVVAAGGTTLDITQDSVLAAERVTLKPAYDFFSPLRPVQGPNNTVGFARDPVVTPYEFALGEVPVHVRVGTVAFFEDMDDMDRKTFESFVNAADSQKLAARAQRSGIALPESGGKPGGGIQRR